MGNTTYIIARYTEDISWSDSLERVVIQKDVDMPNVGREPASYFHFILRNYDQLKGDYVFCQGNPFDHAPKLLEGDYGITHWCDGQGNPEHSGLPVDEVMLKLGLGTHQEYKFKAGCQFRVRAKTIKERPKEFYQQCYDLCIGNELIPYVFERIVPYIFKLTI